MSAFRGELNRVGSDDMITLSSVDERSIVDNLKKRLKAGIIYTAIGSVQISVNPFKDLQVFSKSMINKYRAKQAFEVPPHIFTLAETAYKALLTEQVNQAVIISGESGAGKTEAAKGILEFIAAVSGGGQDAVIANVKKVFLESNALCETFGNAKTLRNNNSSRFGKYLELFFKGGAPVGGRIRVFLLEKNRCVWQAGGERNFHAFYQVFHSSEAKQAFKLTAPGDFRLLTNGAMTVDGISDARDFKETEQAMVACGLGDRTSQIWSIVAGLLHLGNAQFSETPKGCQIQNMAVVQTAATLLGVQTEMLQTVLCFRAISSASARNTQYQKPNSVEEANSARDAFICGAYDRLFLWLVEAINKAMPTSGDGLSISILDIFGFECFDSNGFSQLLINFMNEALQKLFVDQTLKAEQAEYANEGIPWTPIQYRDNEPNMQLIVGKPGVLKLLDDAVLFPTGSDASFLENMQRGLHSHPCFNSTKGETTFTLSHYAGDVVYESKGFLDANRDKMLQEMKDLLSVSQNSALRDAAELTERGPGAGGAQPVSPGRPAPVSPGRGPASPGRGAGGKKRPANVSVQFQKQAKDLLTSLYSTAPHYVRCIKSNDQRQPLGFDDQRVMQQVQYLGLSEQVRVRRAGYAYRCTYERWLRRFALCDDRTYPHYNGSPKDGALLLLATMGISESSYSLGKTKLFVKDPQVLTQAETFRLKRLEGFGEQVQLFKPPKKPTDENNLLLQLLENLIFPELGEFELKRVTPEGADASIRYTQYGDLYNDYMRQPEPRISGAEIRDALLQLLTDVVEPLKTHVVAGGGKKKKKWYKSIFKFWRSGRQSTA